jgi:hypothetical protein
MPAEQNGNQPATAGFASGGGVDDDSDAGEVHPAGGVAGLAPATDPYDPFAAEKFVPEDIAQAAPQIARNLTTTMRPDKSQEHVKFKTKNPMTDISDEDIDRGMGVAMATGPGSIKAYHGSPHDFDAFDLSKIGTGEGAQAYGHGLYFAENEGVAKSYADALAQPKLEMPNGNIVDKQQGPLTRNAQRTVLSVDDPVTQNVIGYLQHHKGNVDSAIKSIEGDPRLAFDMPDELDLLKHWQANPEQAPKFHRGQTMYEVSIAADPEHFLDWDKPLSEQHPKVQEALRSYRNGEGTGIEDALQRGSGRQLDPAEISGGRAIQALQRDLGPTGATNFVSREGIPGIKYLDQGSRGVPTVNGRVQATGNGKFNIVDDFGVQAGPFDTLEMAKQYLGTPKQSHNYVVFNDKLVSILKKYGIAAALAPQIAQEMMQEQQPQRKSGGGSVAALKTAYILKRSK